MPIIPAVHKYPDPGPRKAPSRGKRPRDERDLFTRIPGYLFRSARDGITRSYSSRRGIHRARIPRENL